MRGGKRATVRPVSVCRGQLKHVMAQSLMFGWFYCLRCGQVAVCPECVAVSDSMPLHLCKDHKECEAAYAASVRLVWAEEASAR